MIEAGEYIRTKKGFIGKIDDIIDNYIMSNNDIDHTYGENKPYCHISEIIKSSKNIIDLIQMR
ncbi:MAG: hypothetical protein HFJ59_03955 [Clostridia bacterium]|nr:hypothetical protein [Clostridia bacterium]